MKISRFDWDGNDARGLAAEIRALQPALGEVSETVAEIVEAVKREGDVAVLRYGERFGSAPAHGLRVPDEQVRDASARYDVESLQSAVANVRKVAEAQPGAEVTVSLDQGQSVQLRDAPVAAAGVYVPGGEATYPSSVVMGCVPAKVAGVERIAVATPPGSGGEIDDAVLAAAEISGADEIYATGGAQAIAALALGTETIEPVDVIVGPGNRYVQEAKRQLVGRIGIDGIAGPSELMVIADRGAEPRLLALDLCAQGEHGDDGLLVACASEQPALDEIEALTVELAAERESVEDPPLVLVKAPSAEAGVELANELAPEHLELACADAERLSSEVRFAGCVFIGREGATAFGDYAAGSNHVLPTGGAGRFQGPLGPSTFRRPLSIVRMTEEGARELAPVVATLADAEGFPVHGESATARANRPKGTSG